MAGRDNHSASRDGSAECDGHCLCSGNSWRKLNAAAAIGKHHVSRQFIQALTRCKIITVGALGWIALRTVSVEGTEIRVLAGPLPHHWGHRLVARAN